MAGLLAAQGHDERALVIYDTLLEDSEVDPSVVAEATAVRRRVAERRAGAPHAPVVAIPVRNGAYLIAWQLPEDAIARARSVLGEEGTLAVRVVLVRPDPSAVVAVEVLDRAADIAGEWLIDPLTAGSRLTAAVGVQVEDHFVSAAHTTAIVGG
jgi:hypothetical protein